MIYKKIKIGIFIDGGFIPSYDGATNRFQYLSRHLQKKGVDIVIFYCNRGWSDTQLIKKEPFKTYLLSVNNYYHNINLLADLIKKEHIDIVQFNDLEPILSFGARLSEITKTHLVSEMHYVVSDLARALGSSSKDIRNIKKYEKLVGNLTDHLICLSNDDKPILLDKMEIPDNRISVISSGVDVGGIKFNTPDFSKKTILFLGNLFFKPNAEAVDNIYKYIYPKLKKLGFKFLIVGDCPKKIKDKYKNSKFELVGTVADLNDVFKKATVALAPALEGTGMRIKTLNYLAAGLPVVTTSTSALGFQDKNVLIIENDFKKYPNIILDLISNREYALKISKRGRSLMDKKFNWDHIAGEMKLAYEKILRIPIKNKDKFIKKASKLELTKEPIWLEEAISKGRFADRNYVLANNIAYVVIENNKANTVKNSCL